MTLTNPHAAEDAPGNLGRRSAVGWAVRALFAVVVAISGYLGVTQSLAYAMRASNPVRAYQLAPYDGRIAAAFAQKLSGTDATPADRSRADRLARQALRRDATAVAAVSTLGINAGLRGHAADAHRLFSYSQVLSRRDLQTQLMLLEDAVGHGDIAGALRHYDIALRTSRNAHDLLFPVLAGAIGDPLVRRELSGVLTRSSPWAPAFIEYVAGNGANPRAIVSLLLAVRHSNNPVPQVASSTAIKNLIAAGEISDAWSYYAVVRPGAVRNMARDPHFTADLTHPASFDWNAVDDKIMSASIQRAAKGGSFEFAVPPSVGGVLLQQMQVLPSGTYRLMGHGSGIDEPEKASRPYWTLRCRDGQELGRIVMPNSTRANGFFAGRFDVPAKCPVQILALIARPSNSVTGVAGQIDLLRLEPQI